MKKLSANLFCVITVALILPSLVYAVKPKTTEGKDRAPTLFTIPTTVKDVKYVTGIPEIDVSKYSQSVPANGVLEFSENELIYFKTRINQQKGKGLENVELFRIPYSEIKELYFGYDAVFKAANDALPTALKNIYDMGGWPVFSGRYLPLHMYMKKKGQSAIIVYFNRSKTLTSVVFMTSTKQARSIYESLANQSGIKIKEDENTQETTKD